MTFLPIVDRELRAAARRKGTFRVRTWTTLGALLAASVFLLFNLITRGAAGVGGTMFTVLSGYAFGLCLLAGVALTADCVSEERREGTLGLLFLTDLKGYDVVLGKFFANSLNAVYGLFAVFPVLSLSLLLGGVTGAEFGRMLLVLLNALFLSLAVGLCISAFAEDAQRAMGGALGALFLLAALPPAWSALCRAQGWPAELDLVARLSPTFAYLRAHDVRHALAPDTFWISLAAVHAIGWALLATAAFALPRVWQQSAAGASTTSWLTRRWSGRTWFKSRRATARNRVADGANPVEWLASAGGVSPVVVWGVVVLWAVTAGVSGWLSPLGTGFVVSVYGGAFFAFILKVLFAFQACRFFVEARRNGLLEALLCAPVTTQQIMRGQWLALKQRFLWPVVVLVAVQWFPLLVQFIASWYQDTQAVLFPILFSSISLGYHSASAVTGFFAVGWFGMWLALSLRKPAQAPGATILFVVLLPMLLFCVPGIFADLIFIAWGWSRLGQDLRRLVAEQYVGTMRPVAAESVAARANVPTGA